jgi:hypothetical protein
VYVIRQAFEHDAALGQVPRPPQAASASVACGAIVQTIQSGREDGLMWASAPTILEIAEVDEDQEGSPKAGDPYGVGNTARFVEMGRRPAGLYASR